MSRRRSRSGIDVWPVIADTFLALIAVIVVLASGRKAEDRDVKQLKGAIEKRAHGEFAGLLADVEVGENWIRLIFTDQSLSFTSCKWDLPDSKQADIRRLFRWIGEHRDLLRQIRIEGHSDRRWEGLGCVDIGPFLDNLQLSQNRARAVYNVLLGLSPVDRTGLPDVLTDTQIDSTDGSGLAYIRQLAVRGDLLVAGYGDRRPREGGIADSPKNRRVEVVLEFREPGTGQPRSESVSAKRNAQSGPPPERPPPTRPQ